MKNLFILLFLLYSSISYAQKTVQVVWPFAAGSSQANMVRSVIDSANAQQSKYKFIFTHKPGAGGAVAAQYVADLKELAVLAHTSSFYIRPQLYKESHNIEDFSMVSILCSAQPLAIFSKKLNKLDTQSGEIKLGIIPGSITSLVSMAIKKENPDIKIIEVSYKGTPEATTDMLGGHIDGSVDFIGTTVTSRFGKDVNVLGITGKRSISGYQTFQSIKIKGLENVTNDYFFFTNKFIEYSLKQELNKILTSSYNEKTRSLCEDDFGQLGSTPFNQLDEINQTNKQQWAKLTAGLVKE